MKKVSKLLILFFFMFIYTVPSLYVTTAVAAETSEDATRKDLVYAQGLNNSLRAITKVSQYHYTDSNSASKVTISNKPSGNFTSLSAESISPGGKPLAGMLISRTGYVTIYLSNEVELTNLRFYHILPVKNQLYCDINNGSSIVVGICENAKTVYKNASGVSNWSEKSKYGNFVYRSEIGLEEDFDKSTSPTGARTYSNFNILNELEGSTREAALDKGIYFVSSMTVTYKGSTYYIGDYTLDDKVFTSIGNETTATLTGSVNSYAGTSHSSDGVTVVSQVAALLRPFDARGINDNEGTKMLNNYFVETVMPVIIIVVGILFLVVGAMTGVKIVQTSDEPDERRNQIKKLVGIFIGAVAIALIFMFYKNIIEAISVFLQD